MSSNKITENNINENNINITESVFEQEVYDMLSRYIDPNRIRTQYKLGGFRIDIVILSLSQEPIIAIECDGAKYHSSNEAYSWDLFRQQYLERYGLKFYRIWSTNWWNNTDRELTKLVDFIRNEG